ncbi:MAG: hypothetical protein NWE93_14795 [Candidatus Bathyarchaeota archaeon]|nr:hypothetical protein [Candidatus Bathyarchaeota archaeon]
MTTNEGSLDVIIGFETDKESDEFSPWNQGALRELTLGGAITPVDWTFHVTGNLYEVPDIARAKHRCAGSINFNGIDPVTGDSLSLSHVFYYDETLHNGSLHWNHEIYFKRNDGDWILYDKSNTEHHIIDDANCLVLWARDSNNRSERCTVQITNP